jgi:DNA-directed RNA polymerase subunit RPC12/RpoP
MDMTCSECGGKMEHTVVSGIVSLKRRRSAMASGRVSSLRGETCIECGYTRMYAERPERLFRDLKRGS